MRGARLAALPVQDPRQYSLVHGSAEVPSSFDESFKERRLQIGPYEQLAALLVYTSVHGDTVRGRSVVHWIDNSGAVAAAVNGVLKGTRVPRTFASHARDARNAGGPAATSLVRVRQ